MLLENLNAAMSCAETIAELNAIHALEIADIKEAHEKLESIGYGIVTVLAGVITALWIKINKKDNEIKEEKKFLKEEYKDMTTIFVEFKGLLTTLVKGVDNDIPTKIDQLKTNVDERIEILHNNLKNLLKNGRR